MLKICESVVRYSISTRKLFDTITCRILPQLKLILFKPLSFYWILHLEIPKTVVTVKIVREKSKRHWMAHMGLTNSLITLGR
jgi:hypothetical protein